MDKDRKVLDTCQRCNQPVYADDLNNVAYGPTTMRYQHLNCPGQATVVIVGTDPYNTADYWRGQTMRRDGVIGELRRSLEECAEQIEHCLGTSNPIAQRARELVKQTAGDGR